jgi:hypothetical protein
MNGSSQECETRFAMWIAVISMLLNSLLKLASASADEE